MRLNGTNVFLSLDYKPEIKTAIKWNQVSDGNFKSSDRTSSQDVYQADITVFATYETISAVSNLLQSNRETFVLNLSAGEEIFGPHIDYSSSVSATVKKYGELRREGFKAYSIDITLQAIQPSTNSNVNGTSISTSLGTIKHIQTSTTDKSWEINKRDSYSGSFSYIDHSSDIGKCELRLRSFATPISGSPLAEVVKALTVNTRSSSFSFPAGWGEARPFGPRSPGPWTCVCTKWALLPRTSNSYWEMTLTLQEVV